MVAVEYYWERAAEALAQADRSSIGNCFISIALVYRSLADGERAFQRRFPKIPPRQIDLPRRAVRADHDPEISRNTSSLLETTFDRR
jgi:hypothetical protein